VDPDSLRQALNTLFGLSHQEMVFIADLSKVSASYGLLVHVTPEL